MTSDVEFSVMHWGPCVVQTKVEQDVLSSLYAEAMRSKKDASGELAGLLDSQIFLEDKEKFTPFFEIVFQMYNHSLTSFGKKFTTPPKYILEKLWCNFQKQHDFNPPHSHSGALSFVIYLKIPDELVKENKKYRGQSIGPGGISFHYGDAKDYSIVNHSFFPKEGDMFIFPSWITHWVYPYQSHCTRVSVSGNIIDKIKIDVLEKAQDGLKREG